MEQQKTIARSLFFEGIGLHTGEFGSIFLLPADENVGIIFEIEGKLYRFDPSNVSSTSQNITISFGKYEVMTVEHLFSVFTGLGIDNIIIKINEGREIPILDGSARVFVDKILEVGLVNQKDKKSYFYIDREFEFRKDDNQYLIVKPSDKLIVDYEIEFDVIGKEKIRIEINQETFVKEISPARTFGFIEDAEILKKKGLALGASMENVHVYSRVEGRSLNQGRFPNENVRHKILDLLGAIALFSPTLRGEFIARKSGHYIDVKLMQQIFNYYM
ncbi:MAG: UDP-3-O-acyl-N-acetylglucosamine deacetylase [Brevinematia bacterium]